MCVWMRARSVVYSMLNQYARTEGSGGGGGVGAKRGVYGIAGQGRRLGMAGEGGRVNIGAAARWIM